MHTNEIHAHYDVHQEMSPSPVYIYNPHLNGRKSIKHEVKRIFSMHRVYSMKYPRLQLCAFLDTLAASIWKVVNIFVCFEHHPSFSLCSLLAALDLGLIIIFNSSFYFTIVDLNMKLGKPWKINPIKANSSAGFQTFIHGIKSCVPSSAIY